MSITISVIVCTHNCANLLEDILARLCVQTLDPSQYEIIVVDNALKDETRQLTKRFCRYFPNVRYCIEPQFGLSHARNRGWKVAVGQYIAYVDDDFKMPTEWLSTALHVIRNVKPAVFGGPYFVFYNLQRPLWWKNRYGSFDLSWAPRPLKPGEYVSGGNFFIQRGILEAVSGFDTAYDMAGKQIAYGEETDLQLRIRAAMSDVLIYYEPMLYVHHLVRPEKMNARWILRSRFTGGRYSYHIFRDAESQTSKPSQLRLLVRGAQTLLKFAKNLVAGLFIRDRDQYPYIQNYLYENAGEYIHVLGLIYEQYVDYEPPQMLCRLISKET